MIVYAGNNLKRNHWAFCWWKALDLAGRLSDLRIPICDDENIWNSYTGFELASMWLDGAPPEMLP